jgi:metal-sulfur cluster biosynthetic enzyme
MNESQKPEPIGTPAWNPAACGGAPSSDTSSGTLTESQLWEALRPIQDPEIHLGIVDLGLIYGVEFNPDGTVRVRMTLTSPACPIGPLLQAQVHSALLKLSGVKEVQVELVWDPPWDPRTMASDEIKMELGLL